MVDDYFTLIELNVDFVINPTQLYKLHQSLKTQNIKPILITNLSSMGKRTTVDEPGK
jgi:hypothetical protein